MSQASSIRQYVKSIPVLGRAAQLALEAFNGATSLVYSWFYHGVRRLRHAVAWSLVDNPKSRRLYLIHKPVLTAVQEGLVADLTNTGIAIAAVESAGVDAGAWNRLRQRVQQFSRTATELLDRANPKTVESLDYGVLHHNRDRLRRFFADQDHAVDDDYIIKMNPENSVFHANDPLVAVGLGPAVLNVVNGYFGLWSKMVYADAWHSIPLGVAKRFGSQRWHRDGLDWKMVKVYLLCEDVDDDAGPMEFMPGTTHSLKGAGHDIARWRASGGGGERYPSMEQVERHLSTAARLSCGGPAGTLMFCDTTGFHRGGIPRLKSRILATWTFVTPASLSTHRYTIYSGEQAALSDEARFAVS